MYENDVNARYLASRVIKNKADKSKGMPYERAITAASTTKAAIDWWISALEREVKPL